MGREFELKYAADAAAQTAIEKAFGDFETTQMVTTYYDTPGGALAARHITLRQRFENGRSVCTLKTPTGSLSRGEWEMECGSVEQAFPELCKLSGWELLPLLKKEGVIPICGARFVRKARTVSLPQCSVEIALDTGLLHGGGRQLPLCEVEIELKSGEDGAAVAFAEELAKKYGLQPEFKSKFRRALNLTVQEEPNV